MSSKQYTCSVCGDIFGRPNYRPRKGVQPCCSKRCSTKKAADAARARWEAIRAGERARTASEIADEDRVRYSTRAIAARYRSHLRRGFGGIHARCMWCGDMAPIQRMTGRSCDGDCTVMIARVSAWASRNGLPGVTDESVSAYRDAMSDRNCGECGDLFTPYASNGRFCSTDCCATHHGRLYKRSEAGKAAKRTQNQMRRARRYGNGPVDKIDPIDVFIRDGWRCHVCGVYTPKGLRGTHDDRAPEMDHVIPLAAGGTHTEDNVRCSCRSCNIDKGATIYQEDAFIGNRNIQ